MTPTPRDTHDSPALRFWRKHPTAWRMLETMRDLLRDHAERRRLARRTLPETAERILIIRDRGLGDVLQATTLLEAIRTRYRAERVDLATSEAGCSILQHDSRIDTLLDTSENPPPLENYDLILNLHVAPNSQPAVAWVRAAPQDKLLGRPFHNAEDEQWYEIPPLRHPWLRRYCRIADIPYAPDLGLRIEIPRPPGWEDRVNAFRQTHAGESKTPLALCIGSADPRRNPSVSFLATLTDALRTVGPVWLVGQRTDRDTADRAALDNLTTREGVVDLLDAPLEDLLLSLDATAGVVTPDTGPLHMAVGLQTPVVGLFGWLHPRQVIGPALSGPRHAFLVSASPLAGLGYRLPADGTDTTGAVILDRFAPARIVSEIRRMLPTPPA